MPGASAAIHESVLGQGLGWSTAACHCRLSGGRGRVGFQMSTRTNGKQTGQASHSPAEAAEETGPDRTGILRCLLACCFQSVYLSVCLFLTKLPAEGPETRLAFAITVLDWGFFLKRGGARNRWY